VKGLGVKVHGNDDSVEIFDNKVHFCFHLQTDSFPPSLSYYPDKPSSHLKSPLKPGHEGVVEEATATMGFSGFLLLYVSDACTSIKQASTIFICYNTIISTLSRLSDFCI